MKSPDSVTQLLVEWGNGDQQALDRLVPLVYDELHRQAGNYLRRERLGHTLQPTALVNEAYLKLIGRKKMKWQNRAQFYGVAAQIMRRILVDHARKRVAAKRGGKDQQRLSIAVAEYLGAKQPKRDSAVDLLALHDALKELASFDPRQSQIIELKFFGGLSIDETAAALGISHATVEREWKSARAWLRRKIERA